VDRPAWPQNSCICQYPVQEFSPLEERLPMPKDKSSESDPKRFRIAFSFAGEKRDFVEKVARILANRFGEDRILYDKYHKAEFSQANLGFDLPKLYHDSTDLIVAVFCPNYPNKEWCGLEWRAI